MSLGIWNLEWLNHNSQRSYPISDASHKRCSQDNNIRLPDDLILALTFATHSGQDVNINDFYIKNIIVTGVGCTIRVGYADSIVAITHISVEDTDEIVTSILTGVGDFDDTVGYIAINARSSFLKACSGSFDFDLDGARLCVDCIRPMIRSVSSIAVDSLGTTSERLYGDIVLRAGTNVTLSTTSLSADSSVITISAVNQPYEEECDCTDNAEMPLVRSIAGVTPDSSGNIAITGTDCAKVGSSSGAVTLSDTCAEPCCGCEELEALEQEIIKFADGKTTLEAFIGQLLGQFASMQAVIAVSDLPVRLEEEEEEEPDA